MGKKRRRRDLAGGPPELSTRSIDSFADAPGLTEQLLAIQGMRDVPYRTMSVRQALSVPAVMHSVQLIAGIIGSLPMLAYRNGVQMNPTPRLVARPDPFTTVRGFLFGTGWNMAARGEAIHYAAAVDADEAALTILNLPLAEVQVDWDERQLERTYTWRGRALDAARVRHIRLFDIPGELRGLGPLQLMGAALSVAAEADEWAARYFGEGGLTAVHLHSEAKLTDAEADAIKARWIERTSAVRVTSGGVMTAAPLGIAPAEAQLVESRMHSRGEMAVAFGIPGKLMEYSAAGSSLTYQNVGDVMTDFARQTLSPMYLVPIEQAMTDFLTRSTVARFDLAELLRADPKTRYGIHQVAIASGIYPAEYAAAAEGVIPGASGTMPAPAPGDVPDGLPSAANGYLAPV